MDILKLYLYTVCCVHLALLTGREMNLHAWWHLVLLSNDTESRGGDTATVIELLKGHSEV